MMFFFAYHLLQFMVHDFGGQLLVHFWPFNALCASLKCAEERLQRIESTVFIYLLHRTIKDSWNTKHSCQKWSELRGLKFKLFFISWYSVRRNHQRYVIKIISHLLLNRYTYKKTWLAIIFRKEKISKLSTMYEISIESIFLSRM